MAVTVRGTDILFNDGTTQSTAAGAVTTANVTAAYAGAAANAVGTYRVSSTGGTAGATQSGASLGFGTGTWRNMGGGTITATSGYQVSTGTAYTWLRIS